MGFLQNRVLATVNYFIKDTKNMLLAPPAVGTLGRAAIPDQNIGQLRNQGLELELTYQQKVGDFTMTLSGNATFIKNQITKLQTPGGFLAGPLTAAPTRKLPVPTRAVPMVHSTAGGPMACTSCRARLTATLV